LDADGDADGCSRRYCVMLFFFFSYWSSFHGDTLNRAYETNVARSCFKTIYCTTLLLVRTLFYPLIIENRRSITHTPFMHAGSMISFVLYDVSYDGL
jgi:hypothetical protein